MGREWELLLVTRRQSIPPPSGGSPWCETSLSPSNSFPLGTTCTWSTGAQRLCFLPSPRTAPRKRLAQFWKILGNIRDIRSSSTSFLFVLHATPPRKAGRGCVQWASPTLPPPCLLLPSLTLTVLLAPPQRTNWPPLTVLSFGLDGVGHTHCSSEIFVFIASFKKKKQLAIEQSMEISGLFPTKVQPHCPAQAFLLPFRVSPYASAPITASSSPEAGIPWSPCWSCLLLTPGLQCPSLWPYGPQKSGWPAPALLFLVRHPCSNRSHPALTLPEKHRLEGKYRLTSASKRWRWEPIL